MRKFQIEQVRKYIKIFDTLHDKIRQYLDNKSTDIVLEVLPMCQEKAIELGNLIESYEGEGFITITYLEDYCETVFSIYQDIQSGNDSNSHKINKKLNKALLKVENSIKNDIVIRKEAVFLPYKASMWDSLESIWKAAKEDPNCDVYVIPIPYYDKNPDGSYREMHYESDLYPDYISITKYDEYDFGQHRPDMVFIHNPYDASNYVTTIHPFFYSDKIKKFTDCLVYVPYFATAGGMSEGQKFCPAYINADYIVVQSEKYRTFYDERIPNEKFLPFGSPKFDAVINKCQNPPEIPHEWEKFIFDENGNKKKVYFYNTSIGGMLVDTESFLKKMEYVFDIFKDRDDVCLLWRPHPLMESTIDSMRYDSKEAYNELKSRYIRENIGILDLTPSIEDTIAISDAYIGDSATSVTSLFGVAGKPLFILNNNIHSLPSDDDWKSQMWQPSFQTRDGRYHNKYHVTYNNKLFYSPNDDNNYKYFCDLSEYSGGGYYVRAYEHLDKIYVFPCNAEHILVISKDKNIRRIDLKHEVEQTEAFVGLWVYGDYAFLLPNRYPALVRFNLNTEEILYLNGLSSFNIAEVNGVRIPAAKWIWQDKMYFMNSDGTKLLCVNTDTLENTIEDIDINQLISSVSIRNYRESELWFIPYEGTKVVCWDILSRNKEEFDINIEGLQAVNRIYKVLDNKKIFSSAMFEDRNNIIFTPYWGNKFVKLDRKSKAVSEWQTTLDTTDKDLSDYIPNYGIGYAQQDLRNVDGDYTFYHLPTRKCYQVDLHTGNVTEVVQSFDKNDVYNHVSGYGKESQWLQYCCCESVFNSLKDELDGNIHGKAFDKEKQIEEYMQINASPNGDCGKKVYDFVAQK